MPQIRDEIKRRIDMMHVSTVECHRVGMWGQKTTHGKLAQPFSFLAVRPNTPRQSRISAIASMKISKSTNWDSIGLLGTPGSMSFHSFSGLTLVESMTRLSAGRILLIFAGIQSGPRGSLRRIWLP